MHFIAQLPDVDAKARPKIQNQLDHTFADTLVHSKISIFDVVKPVANSGTGDWIERFQPLRKGLASIFPLANQDFSGTGMQVLNPHTPCDFYITHSIALLHRSFKSGALDEMRPTEFTRLSRVARQRQRLGRRYGQSRLRH